MSVTDPPCPCGTGRTYVKCCGRYISAGEIPERPEHLMRSRYTAFVRGDVSYLLATWHASTRPALLEPEDGVKWLGLKVLRAPQVGTDDRDAVVEFVARYRIGGNPARRMHETSRFVREHGRWYYVDGIAGE